MPGRSKSVSHLIIWSIIGTGISSVAVQIIVIREFLSQFSGNEITISLVLFSWLLLTGLGSLLARPVNRPSLSLYTILCLFLAVWPIVQVSLIRGLRELFFVHGVSPGFYQTLFFITVMILPYCVSVGFILPCSLKVMAGMGISFDSGDLYITDSIGDIIGGMLFSFFLVYRLKPFGAIAVMSTVLIIAGLMLSFRIKNRFVLVAGLLLVCIFFIISANREFEISTLKKQYGDIVQYSESPFGRIIVTKEGQQYSFWESGLPLYSNEDIVSSEEKTHYPLSQLDDCTNILLISGGLGETLKEVYKHRPERVDYVELDPNLTDIAQEMGIIPKMPGLNIINQDGRHYIESTDIKYSAIIVDLPDPATFQINRFFTREFIFSCKKVLTEDGVLSFNLDYSQNYISDIRKSKLSITHNTLKGFFRNVLLLPGENAYFICGDSNLKTDIPELLRAKSVETSYIDGYFYGNVTEARIRKLKNSLDPDEHINTDFRPRVMNVVFKEWFSKQGRSPKYFIIALALLTAIYIIFMRREEYILFSTGMATMGVEMLIIFVYQVLFGYIYLKIGAIVTVILLGLLPGSIIGKANREGKWRHLAISEIILLALLVLFFLWLNLYKEGLHQLFFLVYCFIFSFFCGYQFPIVTNIIGENRSPAAGCIAADLAGAALGTVLIGTILIPLGGIHSAIIFLLLVKVSSFFLLLIRKTKE